VLAKPPVIGSLSPNAAYFTTVVANLFSASTIYEGSPVLREQGYTSGFGWAGDHNPQITGPTLYLTGNTVLQGTLNSGANVISGNGSGLTFTNAAGASFRLIVNSSTNGFNFVPR